jgi:phospholipid transport system substrate-binding protein
MKNIVPALFAACALAAPAAMAQVTPPDVLAKTVTEEVLALIRADKELQAGNSRRIAELIETKIAPHFSFAAMTQLAMGRNWNLADAQQKKALTAEFRTLLVRTYTTAFTQYRNQTVEYRPLKLAPADTDVIVRSQIRQSGGPPVAVDYRMEKSDAGWKVYDVRIEGISLVENYRNTFNSEVQKGGIDGLIKSLADKNKALLAQAPAR